MTAMGGEREQRDARSAHAGALWSLMEPYVATGTECGREAALGYKGGP